MSCDKPIQKKRLVPRATDADHGKAVVWDSTIKKPKFLQLGDVTSVNEQTGDVVLDSLDIMDDESGNSVGDYLSSLQMASTTNQNAITEIIEMVGQANGIAPTGSDNKIPTSFLPQSLLGANKFKGFWDAETDTILSMDPDINGEHMPEASEDSLGWFFIVNVPGETDLGDAGADWRVGDWVVGLGTQWGKIDNTDAVTSVNGKVGIVVLTANDIEGIEQYGAITLAAETTINSEHTGKLLLNYSGSNIPLILPTNSDDPLPIDFRFFVCKIGEGGIPVTGDVTIIGANTGNAPYYLKSKNSIGQFLKTGLNTWLYTEAVGYDALDQQSLIEINRKSANYTLQLTDRNKLIDVDDDDPNTITVPLEADVPFPVGSQILLAQYGSGQTTIEAAVGVNIRSNNGLILAGQYAGATLIKIGSDEWYLFGNLTE